MDSVGRLAAFDPCWFECSASTSQRCDTDRHLSLASMEMKCDGDEPQLAELMTGVFECVRSTVVSLRGFFGPRLFAVVF